MIIMKYLCSCQRRLFKCTCFQKNSFISSVFENDFLLSTVNLQILNYSLCYITITHIMYLYCNLLHLHTIVRPDIVIVCVKKNKIHLPNRRIMKLTRRKFDSWFRRYILSADQFLKYVFFVSVRTHCSLVPIILKSKSQQCIQPVLQVHIAYMYSILKFRD